MSNAQEIYRTTNDADLQNALESKVDNSTIERTTTEMIFAGLMKVPALRL